MKVLGLSCGRPMGNSELLIRESLGEVKKLTGAEIEIVRLLDLYIKPCTGCETCNNRSLGEGCVITRRKEDHVPFLMEKLAQADGLILGAPAHSERPPGYLMTMCDRVNRHTRNFKGGVGAIIGVGGTDWVSMLLPLLNTCMPVNFKIVDQMLVDHTMGRGQVLVNETAMFKARSLGQNVAAALKTPREKIKYLGKEDKCPVCHNHLFLVENDYVECPICYVRGTIEKGNKETRVVFTEEAKEKWLRSPWSLQHHRDVLERVRTEFEANKEQIDAKLKQYKPEDLVSPPPPIMKNI